MMDQIKHYYYYYYYTLDVYSYSILSLKNFQQLQNSGLKSNSNSCVQISVNFFALMCYNKRGVIMRSLLRITWILCGADSV